MFVSLLHKHWDSKCVLLPILLFAQHFKFQSLCRLIWFAFRSFDDNENSWLWRLHLCICFFIHHSFNLITVIIIIVSLICYVISFCTFNLLIITMPLFTIVEYYFICIYNIFCDSIHCVILYIRVFIWLNDINEPRATHPGGGDLYI